MDILSILFAMMQIAVANGAATELSTLASVDFPMPNLIVVLNNLGFGSLESRDFPHVRIRICPVDYTTKLRVAVESIVSEDYSIDVNLDKFWNGCPYGCRSFDFPWAWEIETTEAEKLLTWTLHRGQDIRCSDPDYWSIES